MNREGCVYERKRKTKAMSNEYNKSKYLPLLCRASTKDIKPHFSGDPSSPRVTCIGHVKRSNKITAATPTTRRLKTITATTPGVCGLPLGSPLRPKTTHKKTSSNNPPDPSPRTPKTTAVTPIGLNSNYSVPKTTLEKSSTGSWMTLNTTGNSNVNYFKLKRLLFPDKIIQPITRNTSGSREIKMVNCIKKVEVHDESRRNYDVELDPPLPVVKIVKEPGFDREEVNLWKRRSSKSGIEFKSLKIQQIDVGNNNHYQIPTSV